MKKTLRSIGLGFIGVLLVAAMMHSIYGRGKPIPSARLDSDMPAMVRNEPIRAAPIKSFRIEPHPFMRPQDQSSMHAGGYNSDVHLASGPVGRGTQMRSRQGSTAPGGMNATVTFDNDGLLVVFMGSFAGFELNLLEPRTLKLLARYKLPQRPSTFEGVVKADPDIIMADTSSSYFYMDQDGYVIMADSTQHILRIGHRRTGNGAWEFFEDRKWDLREHVPHDCLSLTNWFPSRAPGVCDPITAVTPDHDGFIWWVTLHGRVGVLDPNDGSVVVFRFEQEQIQNAFAVAADGIYIVTTHAMYGFDRDGDDRPVIRWREAFDRGQARKLGAISQGSGTTPTLLGDDYVVIADNAEPQTNLLVMKRAANVAGDRLVCRVPLFEPGRSVVEISMVAYGNTVITKNDYGYKNAMQQEDEDWGDVAGGFVRIDIRDDESGCEVVWQNSEKSPSVVPKLAYDNGLLYSYSPVPQADGTLAWYLIAIDVDTGRTVFRFRTGAGFRYDPNWGPMTIGPDDTVYVTTYAGIIAIWDQGPPAGPY